MDYAILDFVQEHVRSPALDAAMLFATHLGDIALVWLAASAALIVQPKRRAWGIAMLVAVAVTAAVGMLVLKPLFGRVRPFEALEFSGLLIPAPSGSSFPSNHSMVSFAAATVVCCLPKDGPGVRIAKALAVLIAALIALSRIYLYVHYPSDILAGAILGVCFGLLSVGLVKRLWPKAFLQS
ncbi:phosphatase PAP2 family protein [Gordonibacter sp. An230]|uniref:phosphatase PAP2 family protein n=1 Tax=Gordonibacter sp. An230 TaxID=1965592 RepID=UPI000B3AA13A|nr:phosphatase PAP2 family protein [Gordonibacter sp. An230]OUO91476.1 phosphatase PAP2 family protein [Gordonibacter sp. An230]